MDARADSLRGRIELVPQFRVPCYQRPYSWETEECKELWDDILESGKRSGGGRAKHFLGCLICIKENDEDEWEQPVLIIDGQQRITTMLLLFEALARSIENEEKDFGAITVPSLRKLIFNDSGRSDDRLRIRLSGDDQKVFADLMNQIDCSNDKQSNIVENFNFFTDQIKELSQEDVNYFSKGLAGLRVVAILLSHTDDDPQYVFESMNSKGKDLSVTDLARNYLLMKLTPQKQEIFHKKYWLQIANNLKCKEEDFTEQFLRDYLICQKGEGVGKSTKRIYEQFKKRHEKSELKIEEFLQELLIYSDFYSRIVCPGKEDNEELASAFDNWRGFSKEAQMPLMLTLYASFKNGCFNCQEFMQIVRMIGSYVFRRWACSMPPNARNAVFLELIAKINKGEFDNNHYFHGLSEFLRSPGEDSKKRFPGDDEFIEHLVGIDIYVKGGNCWYVLSMLEKQGYGKEGIDLCPLTIEHIMPQKLTPEWKDSLGLDDDKCKEMHASHVHKLGNLTLTGYNPELSNMLFLEKRDYEEGGFKSSPAWLNKELGQLEVWNQEEIEKRGKALAEIAAKKVWTLPAPSK